MKITRVGSVASTKGPADWFTGSVRIDPLFPLTADGTPMEVLSPSNQERAPGGTLTRLARRSSSHRVLVGCSEIVAPLKK